MKIRPSDCCAAGASAYEDTKRTSLNAKLTQRRYRGTLLSIYLSIYLEETTETQGSSS